MCIGRQDGILKPEYLNISFVLNDIVGKCIKHNLSSSEIKEGHNVRQNYFCGHFFECIEAIITIIIIIFFFLLLGKHPVRG